jgi:hypothetical protein
MPNIQRFSKTIILKNLKSNTDNDDHQQWYKEEIIQPVYEKMQELEMPTNILHRIVLITLRVFYKNCDENKLLQIIIIFL